MVSAGAVIWNPFPTPPMYNPVVLLVALAVGVPPFQVKPNALSEYRLAAPVPTTVKLLICEVTPALWSKLVAEVNPQCAQSTAPRVVRFCVPDGVANDPASDPVVPPEVTVNVTVVVWTRAPLVPVIVRVELPTGVLALVVTVMVDDPVSVTVVGLKLAVAPVGSPLALKLTTPLKPPDGVTVAV